MIRGALIFFVFLGAILLFVIYFAGNYHLDLNYLTSKASGSGVGERDLVFDTATKGSDFYTLKVTSSGKVSFQKDDRGERDFKSFEIQPSEVQTIRDEMDKSQIFKVVSLDRTYCFDRYHANLSLDFGWVGKKIKYSNCLEDPTEVKTFRKFLYNFLGLKLKGI